MSVRPGPISASAGAGRLASTLASAARPGFGRFLPLLLGHARIGLCVLARRQRLGVLPGLLRGLRDGSVGSGRNGQGRMGAEALGDLAGGRSDLNGGLCWRGSWRGRGQQERPEMR